MAHITVTDNFSSEFLHEKITKKQTEYKYTKNSYFKASAATKLSLFLDGKSFKNLEESFVLSLNGVEQCIPDDELILSIQEATAVNGETFWRVQSGNFIGNIQYQGHSIELKSRFQDMFLQRMLSVANNVYLSDFEGRDEWDIKYAEYILYFLFVQKVEKAFLLGFPKTYRNIKHHETTVKGKADISQIIKKDMPYKGKVSSVKRERVVDADILSVLNQALKIIFKRARPIAQNVRHVHNAISQMNPGRYDRGSFNKAQKSKSLANPLFAPFRDILNLARLIINGQSIKSSKNNTQSSFGFLVNIAELFELYVKSLLQKNFPDWTISTPEISLYQSCFYSRKIIPDIVMARDSISSSNVQIVVFDTKYKQMRLRGTAEGIWDLDRSDFFQIHTYMSFFNTHPNYQLIGGGLLYPISKEFDILKCHSNRFLDNSGDAWFIVDGVELEESELTLDVLIEQEKAFLTRIYNLIYSG